MDPQAALGIVGNEAVALVAAGDNGVNIQRSSPA